MKMGRVIGAVVASRKDEKLQGLKLLVVRNLDLEMANEKGYVVAADAVGAGAGEVVLYATGSSARQTALTDGRPVDAVIMAIVDEYDVVRQPPFGDVRGQARCHSNLGIAMHMEAKYDDAKKHLAISISLARAAGMADLSGTAAMNLGVMTQQMGDRERARELFSDALGLFAAIKNSELQLYALFNLANLDRETKQYESGAALYEACASLAQRIGNVDLELGSIAGEGICYLEMGNIEAARVPYAVLEERRGVAEQVARKADLLVIFLVHEGQHVAVGEQELEILGVEADALDRLGGAEADVVLAAVDQVLELDLHVGAALARLGVLDLHRAPDAAFIFDDVAGTNVHAADLHAIRFPLDWLKEQRRP